MAEYIVCSLDEIREKKKIETEAGGERVVVFYHDDSLHCVQALCPHRGAPLKDAHLCEKLVICSWHRSVFDLTSGKYLSGPCSPDLGLKRYPIKVNEGFVVVEN